MFNYGKNKKNVSFSINTYVTVWPQNGANSFTLLWSMITIINLHGYLKLKYNWNDSCWAFVCTQEYATVS